jgi:hypothetical protein
MVDSSRAVQLLTQQLEKRVEECAFHDQEVERWYSLTERIVEEAFGRKSKQYSPSVSTQKKNGRITFSGISSGSLASSGGTARQASTFGTADQPPGRGSSRRSLRTASARNRLTASGLRST